MRQRSMLTMRSGDIVRIDFGVPARGEPGFIRPAIIITSDDILAFRQHTVLVIPCTTQNRCWTTDVLVEGLGTAQRHLPTTVSVDRVVEEVGANVGAAVVGQLRELVADLMGL